MKNLSTDTPGDDQEAVDRMYDGLKKIAAEEPGDDDETTVGTMPQPDEEPKDRPKGSIDAPWGEDSPAGMQFAGEQYKKFREGREGLLGKLFGNFNSSGKAHKGIVSQQLSHGSSGGFETSAPQLSDQARKVVNES